MYSKWWSMSQWNIHIFISQTRTATSMPLSCSKCGSKVPSLSILTSGVCNHNSPNLPKQCRHMPLLTVMPQLKIVAQKTLSPWHANKVRSRHNRARNLQHHVASVSFCSKAFAERAYRSCQDLGSQNSASYISFPAAKVFHLFLTISELKV